MRDHHLNLSSQDTYEQNITHALERSPRVELPPNFAQRVAGVAASLPARTWSATVRRSHYGRNATLAGIAVLLLALLWSGFELHGISALSLEIECTLALQLALLTLWYAFRRQSWN